MRKVFCLAALGFFACFQASAEELSCNTDFDIQACADGSGGAGQVREAARQYRKNCQQAQAKIQAQPKLKAQCAHPGKKTPLTDCTDQWDKQSRTLGDLLDKVGAEKKDLNKIFLTLLAPEGCEALEKNKTVLRDLIQRYDTLVAAVNPPRQEAREVSGVFQKEFIKTLIPFKNIDPAKHYAGTGDEAPRAPPAPEQVSKMGWVDRVTAYRIALEVNYPGPKDTNLQVGDVTVKVTAAFAKVLRLEGSGVLSDGRLVNSGGGRYIFVPVIKAPYGLGSYKRTPLVPFRSIAVDPKEIPLGSTVFIYEARGMPLPPAPDGTPLFHDGYFRAVDVGHAILGTHIDVYSGDSVEDYRFVQKFFYNRTVHYFVLK